MSRDVVDLDNALGEMFERRARSPQPIDLRAQILSVTASTQQRRRSWSGALGVLGRGGSGRLLAVALLVTATLALSVGLAGRQPDEVHTVASGFFRPFEFTVPADSDLVQGPSGYYITSWVVGTNLPSRPDGGPAYGGQGVESGNTRGIIVASGESAWTHAGDRMALPRDPAAFLGALRDFAATDLGPTVPSALDGRPAVMADTAPAAALTGIDLHVESSMVGLSGRDRVILLGSPYRLILAHVDGTTILVQVWARSDEELADFMPTAMAFIGSIHFSGAASP